MLSSWTALVLNEKFWMRKDDIYSESFTWVWAKSASFTHKKQEKMLAPHVFQMHEGMEYVPSAKKKPCPRRMAMC